MDVDHSQPSGAKTSSSAAVPNAAGDQKELAWAFLGLLLWSAVVFGAIFGVGYLLGRSLFHWW
jgi:hypothetical protein